MIQSKKYHRTIFVDQDGVILENVTYNRKIKKYESKGGIYELI
jgi:histidinol phosphatase-like enzyme